MLKNLKTSPYHPMEDNCIVQKNNEAQDAVMIAG
jgi:hypothetical protein